ncbi:hypothetical protein [Protofrankia sp. BMG5.30]|nr:hypothetical protein [Protofrankia sp. BMG5.30]
MRRAADSGTLAPPLAGGDADRPGMLVMNMATSRFRAPVADFSDQYQN